MKLPKKERHFFFMPMDMIEIPEPCYVVFFSPKGEVMHPNFKCACEFEFGGRKFRLVFPPGKWDK